ncbi:hypothetical protein GCM10010342_04220 [Streptomyces anulatus]|nr:hypothetical protein GCM10010342_04220 [Streptomyces anulatus]
MKDFIRYTRSGGRRTAEVQCEIALQRQVQRQEPQPVAGRPLGQPVMRQRRQRDGPRRAAPAAGHRTPKPCASYTGLTCATVVRRSESSRRRHTRNTSPARPALPWRWERMHP